MSDGNDSRSLRELPEAGVKNNWRRYFFWLIPIAAAIGAGWIFYTELLSQGPTIHIYFDNAEGLQEGKSRMKYRGIEVGKVGKMALANNNTLVKVTVSVNKTAKHVAREGSLFWIVKPEIGLNAVTGLQTIMGGAYVTVEPGTGKRQTEFRGLPQPPPTQKEVPGLRVILLAEKLGSIKQHTPVLYHDLQVGEVHDYELGPEAQVVRIYLNIDRKYAPLVRMNSKFWNAGGLNVNIGWSGISMSAESARTLLTGGIAFATPDTKDQQAYDGAAFRLYGKAESAWQQWFPEIPLPLVQGSPAAPPPAGGRK